MSTRRAKGTGSIIRLEDGKWKAKLSVGKKPNGQTRYATRTRSSRSEATIALNQMIAQREDRKLLAGKQETLRRYAERVLFRCDDVAERTASDYIRVLRLHVFPVLGTRPIRDITTSEVQGLLHQLENHLGSSTINNVRTALSKVYSLAITYGDCRDNPVRFTKKVRRRSYEKDQVKPPWTKEEVKEARERLRGKIMELPVLMLLSTGLRHGELLALTWDDIDFARSTLDVRQTVSHLSILKPDGSTWHGPKVRPPKTDRSDRTVDIPRPVLNLLRIKQQEIAVQRRALGDEWQELNLVFPNAKGGYINQSNFRRRYKKALEEAGIRVIRVHDIRHTFATLLIEEDVNLLVPVSRTLGHASTAITADLYAGTAKVSDVATSAMARNLFGDDELRDSERGKAQEPSWLVDAYSKGTVQS
jgi:integrase